MKFTSIGNSHFFEGPPDAEIAIGIAIECHKQTEN
jgi:hypothetical protein